MKKVLVLALLLVMGMEVYAQNSDKKHVVGIASGTIIGRLRIKYEYLLNEKISVGAIGSMYFANSNASKDYYTGIMLSPIGRYYFSKGYGNGWYGQFKANLGQFKEHELHYNAESQKDFKDGNSFFSIGAGANIGYQLIFKNSKWSLDANFGLKFCSGSTRNHEDYSSWGQINRPGSVLDSHLSICYIF